MTRGPTIACLLAVAVWLGAAGLLQAQQSAGGINLATPTLGGKQFWADELFFHQWRIQRNVFTGHCRLLDEDNVRHAWGTFYQCKARLGRIKQGRELPPMQGKVVIVLHGLFRTRAAMSGICKHLEEHGDYTVLNVGYPSTQRDVGSHARALGRIIENLDGVEEINFVAHSMGNIVIRHYLADRAKWKTPAKENRRNSPPIKRFVMLAPPNHGSLAAVALSQNDAFKAVAGRAGQELGAEWAKLEGKLATPECQFGIVAGGKGDEHGFNPLLPGDDDGTVTVKSTRLDGARDFVVVPMLHTFMIDQVKVHEHTLRFLQHGHFVSEEKRQPVKGKDE